MTTVSGITVNVTDDVKNTYVWWDDAKQDTITDVNTQQQVGSSNSSSSTNTSTFHYLGNARISSIDITGDNARTVTFWTDWQGNVLQRYETLTGTSGSTMPNEMDYFFNDQRLLATSNNGNPDPDSSVEIGFHRTPPSGTMQYGSAQSWVDAGQDYNAINGSKAGNSSRYVVRDGDTLQSIALQLWGDASLWYVLADANGMDGGTQLAAGMSLIVPDKVENLHNNANTFEPYSPAQHSRLTGAAARLTFRESAGGIMRHTLAAVAFIGSATIAAAAFAASPAPAPMSAPPEGKALIYIYRPSNAALLLSPASFDIDGVHVVTLGNNHYTAIAAPPGKHVIGEYFPMNFSFGLKRLKHEATWEAGKTYAYRLDPTQSVWMPMPTGNVVGTFFWAINDTSADGGFGNARYVEPTNVEKLHEQPAPPASSQPSSTSGSGQEAPTPGKS